MLNVQASIDSVKAMFCSIIGYGNMFISTCSTQRVAGPSGGGGDFIPSLPGCVC